MHLVTMDHSSMWHAVAHGHVQAMHGVSMQASHELNWCKPLTVLVDLDHKATAPCRRRHSSSSWAHDMDECGKNSGR